MQLILFENIKASAEIKIMMMFSFNDASFQTILFLASGNVTIKKNILNKNEINTRLFVQTASTIYTDKIC